jgi:heat-inducible transcriptional repressor
MSAEFTERRQLMLKLVVQEFVETASAVASEVLVRKYGLAISSATVRNELAALEDLGYLTQLHTSAGRVPTDSGYRFFVENLMDDVSLSSDEQRVIRHQFYQVRGELDQWIQLGAALLARTTQNAAVITPPQAYQSRFKHLELVAIHDTVVLLVLVLHDGSVRQQTLTLERAYQQDELRRIAHHVNEQCQDARLVQVQEVLERYRDEPPTPKQPERQLVQLILGLVVHAMGQLEDQVNRRVYSDGLIEMLSQPEFIPALLKEEDTNRAIERMRQVLETFSNTEALGSLIVQALASDNVQVIIGGEHGSDEMRDYSVILSRYGINGLVAGVLGVIGPTRMAYPRSISTVRYMSTVMSDLLRTMYGGAPPVDNP